MPSWSEVSIAAPELARAVQARFEEHGLGLMATLRKDGAPRISGIEPVFALGELWLGMMLGSRKAADLLRDARFALHNATIDKQVADGDARISGVAVVVDDEPTMRRVVAASQEQTGEDVPLEPFHLFRADVRELMMVQPEGDHLNIDFWREGGSVSRVERR